MSVRIKDDNNVPDLLRVMQELKAKSLEVGIFGDKDSFIIMVAKVNEFGIDINVTDNMRKWFAAQGYPLKKDTDKIKIPERAFMRGGFDKNEKKINSFVQKEISNVFDLKISVNQFYEKLGTYCTSLIKLYLTDLSDPANSQMTIDKKGSSNPLIAESGRLRASITWRVV